MKIGFVHTTDPRLPYSEDSLAKLIRNGWETMVDARFEYSQSAVPPSDILTKADIIVSAAPLTKEEIKTVKAGTSLISVYGSYWPDFDQSLLSRADLSYYSLDMVPRSTLAQSVDVLSSMASLAGYSAVLLGAHIMPKQAPLMMTAAGTIKPAIVVVLGAGVAGLQAIATARKIGAKVYAFDVRPEVKDEVNSLGAKFIEVEGAAHDIAAGGYAVLQTADYQAKQKKAISDAIENADLVITTAQLRGKPAPTLIDDSMLQLMKNGAVIIDMASASGGNVTGVKDKQQVTVHGVRVVGDSTLYLNCLGDASALLANNFANYISFFKVTENNIIDASHQILTASKIS